MPFDAFQYSWAKTMPPSAFPEQPSAFPEQPSAFSEQPSAFPEQLSTMFGHFHSSYAIIFAHESLKKRSSFLLVIGKMIIFANENY